MANITVCCNSTLCIFTTRLCWIHSFSCVQGKENFPASLPFWLSTLSQCLQLCWTPAVSESSPCSHPCPHTSCSRDLSSQMVSPCNPAPFPTLLQASVLRRARGNREGAQKRCCREEWVSQQLENQRHWEKGNSWFWKKKGITAYSISCRRYALRQALESSIFQMLYSVHVWLDMEMPNGQI